METFEQLQSGKLYLVPLSEIRRVRRGVKDRFKKVAILADIFRLNTLYMITRAGSGHIGSSFSSMDIVVWLWLNELENPNSGKMQSDTYFSSKGHDAPALYSALIGFEKLPFYFIHKLRRLHGLPGHPDIATPFIAANSGSLGMGLSKAKGMAISNRHFNKGGRIFVMLGDGELQEGQIWEALQPIANGKFSEITAIIDANKMQSDNWVKNVSDLGNIEAKFKDFGWETRRVSGHDFKALAKVFSEFKKIKNKPKVLIADTIKGRGVSFMESSAFIDKEFYNFHAGAPKTDDYIRAVQELSEKTNRKLAGLKLAKLKLEEIELPLRPTIEGPVEKLVEAFGQELLSIAEKRKNIVVLDADLWLDGGIGAFKKKFPKRFFQFGIAEQDMVSAAGGMALKGLLPVVHSYASFLSARGNEQMYNNATEKKKIIYVATLSGILPSGPGHSHQSVRDISAVGSIPGLVLLEPANEEEARHTIRFAVFKNKESTYLRFSNFVQNLPYKLPSGHQLAVGRGSFLKKGSDAVLISFGPVMLTEAMKAAEILKQKNFSLAVINMPWLNRADRRWLKTLFSYKTIFILEDHYTSFGFGNFLASEFAKISSEHPRVVFMGLSQIPECGWGPEILAFHELDARSLAERIVKEMNIQ